jgi:hypothetical protein
MPESKKERTHSPIMVILKSQWGMEMLTQSRLLELLEYDLETGIFIRKISSSSRARKGDRAGYCDKSHGYRSISIDSTEYYEHRLAWLYVNGGFPINEIDHINMDRADNKFSNLREATRSQNGQNKNKLCRNTSGVKGVTWHKDAQKWMAQINVNRKHYYLGVFETIKDAGKAYSDASDSLHQSFGRK